MSIKQLQDSLHKNSAPTLSPIKHKPRHAICNMDHYENSGMAKNMSLAKDTWHKLCNWLISHIPESVKKVCK